MPGVTVRKPTWSTSSFVLYVGAFTVLGAAAGALVFFSSRYGDAAFAAWTLLPLAVLYAIAHAFRRGGEWLSAGLFIVADMVVWIAFLGALESWWGWLPDEQDAPFAGWHWGLWLLLVVAIVTAAVDLRQFRFPLLVVFPAALSWFLVVDVLSGGGSWAAVLTLILGLVYFAIGGSLDGGPGRPYGFWMHVAAGLLVGGALFYWWHSSTLDWALVAATAYFAQKWSTGHGLLTLTGGYEPVEIRAWVPPLVFGVVGLFLVLLGLSARERREEPAA
jgi:hypothetical protein